MILYSHPNRLPHMKNTNFTPLFIFLIASTFLASCSNTPSTTVSNGNAANAANNSTNSSSPSSIQKTVNYRTDHRKHTVSVTFDISTSSDGIITGVTAHINSGDRESAEYIERFNNAASRKIVGQKISSLSLGAVWGASDTTDAFLSVVASL